jgi:hypothetical protein
MGKDSFDIKIREAWVLDENQIMSNVEATGEDRI